MLSSRSGVHDDDDPYGRRIGPWIRMTAPNIERHPSRPFALPAHFLASMFWTAISASAACCAPFNWELNFNRTMPSRSIT